MTDPGLLEFVTRLPKAELHVHLEGTIEPSDMFAYASRNGIGLPWETEQELRDAYSYTGLDDFLVLLWQGCRALATRADFYDLTMNYLRRAASQGVTRAEMSLSPQNFLARGVSLREQIGGITEAIDHGRSEFGIESAVLVGIQRHRSEADAFDVLDLMRPYRDGILGIGLGGPEKANPPAKFARLFAAARDEGYRLTAHAGEEGSAASVREAVELCGVDRVDHGNSGIRDAGVRAVLRDRGMPITLCPLSNMRLHVEETLVDHPVRAALDAGLMASVHSDDPAYFDGYIADNYYVVAQETAMSRGDLVTLAVNSFAGSFADPASVATSVERVNAYARSAVLPFQSAAQQHD